jgi:hypothetical protein
MTYLATGGPILLTTTATGWAFDSNNLDLTPATAALAPNDLKQSVGRQLGSGIAASRALVNQMEPVGLYMIQTVPGAETNTFTSRVSITGTLINTGSIGDSTQTAGTFPAGALNVLGRTIRWSGWGTIGTTGTPNWTFDIGFGAAIVATTGVLATNAAITTPANFFFQVYSVVTTVGSSGVVQSGGTITMASATNVTATWTMGNSTPGTGLTSNLTTALSPLFNATCGTSNASNRVLLTGFTAEILN